MKIVNSLKWIFENQKKSIESVSNLIFSFAFKLFSVLSENAQLNQVIGIE